MVGYPSYKTSDRMVRTVYNFPFTVEDIHNANTIKGCDVPNLKGKTVCQHHKRA